MSEKEMMEVWQKVATPGTEHARLARTSGEYEVEMTAWMGPGQPPMTSTGTAKYSMILDGRIRREEFSCDMGGMPFVGIGQLGYDNFTQEYWLTWNDNMFTGILTARGKAGPDNNVITLTGTMDSPMKNQRNIPMRNVYRFENEDHQIFEVYEHAGTADERKSLQIHYRRK